MSDPATGVDENELRETISMHGRSLFERGFGVGSSGNISVRIEEGILVTPTNSCLGRLDPRRIAKVAWDGSHLAGDRPSKEAFLHLAMYRQRPQEGAVVHLHSTHSVAVSCLANVNATDVLPPVTAYYVMRVGRLPLVPYFPPGDQALAEAIAEQALESRAMLLANHGPVLAAADLDTAVVAIEELEETAKLFLLLRQEKTRWLDEKQVRELRQRFPT